jgi:chromosome segregation ATPase
MGRRRFRNPFERRRPRQNSESISQQIARLRREIMNEQGNMNNRRTKIEQQTEKIKQLQIKLDALLASGNTAVSVQSEMSDCNTNLTQAKNDLTNSTSKLQELIVQLAQKQAQYDELIRTTQLTDIELSTATININNLNNKISELTRYIEKLHVQLKSYELDIKNLKNIIDELNRHIFDLTTKLYSNKVINNQILLEKQEIIDKKLNVLFDDLKSNNLNPDLVYQKINYREIEHEKLYNINKLMDILFYSIYAAFIIIIIFTGNIKREHFLIYLFVGLIPIIFPFLFKIAIKIINSFQVSEQGPTNAFVDTNNTIFAYNI